MPTWASRFDKPTPGPGYYAPESVEKKVVGVGESVFRSKTGRSKVGVVSDVGPAPGEFFWMFFF